MLNMFSRSELLIGKDNIEKLKKSKVAIFGIGGVGSFVAEGLVRAGVGNFILIDNDDISITNLNRQIHATVDTIGKSKVEEMKNRMLKINPDVKVEIRKEFYMPNKNNNIIDNSISYVVDAVDTVTAKIEIIKKSKELNIPVISAMGTGNKLCPELLEITDIYKTQVCPLAKVMRKELKKIGIKDLKVIYSKEEPIKPKENIKNEDPKKVTPGSMSFVPSVAGLIIASCVVRDIIK